MAVEVVVVGCSWGGLDATERLLDSVPESVDVPIVVVPHRSPRRSFLAPLLERHTRRGVCEAEDKEAIAGGRVYLAPVGYHLLVERGRFALSTDEPVRFSRPSIDALFESAADAYAGGVVAVVLTGANADGAAGAAAVAARGGRVLVQDPATAERSEMPAAALAAVPDAEVLPVELIGARIAALVGEGESVS